MPDIRAPQDEGAHFWSLLMSMGNFASVPAIVCCREVVECVVGVDGGRRSQQELIVEEINSGRRPI